MKKKCFLVILFFGFVFSAFAQNANDFRYIVENGRITITGFNVKVPETLIIPASINGWPVTAIGHHAFQKNQLTSVTIPNSVTTIGECAFMDNNLASVTIPNSVTTIGHYAFQKNQLTSVTIPNSVTTIGSKAFSNNRLASVTIGTSVTTIGSEAFAGEGNRIERVEIPRSVVNFDSSVFNVGVVITRP